MFFALLFSYVLLFQFHPPTDSRPSIHWTEILLYILVGCFMIEEICYVRFLYFYILSLQEYRLKRENNFLFITLQFFDQESLTPIGKFKEYTKNYFRIMIWCNFTLFFIGFILRFTYTGSEDDFSAARWVIEPLLST